MPKGGPVFRVGGVKFSKSMKKGGCFFLNTNKGGEGKLLETVVSTLV